MLHKMIRSFLLLFYFQIKHALLEKVWSARTMHICGRPKIPHHCLIENHKFGSCTNVQYEFGINNWAEILRYHLLGSCLLTQRRKISCFSTAHTLAFDAENTGHCTLEYVVHVSWFTTTLCDCST